MGIDVPAEPRKRAEIAGLAFLCRMWMNSSDFSLEHLEAAIGELEVGADAAGGEIEVIVPLRGLQMPIARLDLDSVSIVRADTVDVPDRGALERWARRLAVGARVPRGGPRRRGCSRR